MTTSLTWPDVERLFGIEPLVFFDRDVAPQDWHPELWLRPRDARLRLDLEHVDGVRYDGDALWAEDSSGRCVVWTGERWATRDEVSARIAAHEQFILDLCIQYELAHVWFEPPRPEAGGGIVVGVRYRCGHNSRVPADLPLVPALVFGTCPVGCRGTRRRPYEPWVTRDGRVVRVADGHRVSAGSGMTRLADTPEAEIARRRGRAERASVQFGPLGDAWDAAFGDPERNTR